MLLESKNYSLAKEKYDSAGLIYRTYELTERNSGLGKKINECKTHKKVGSKLENARTI